MTTKTINPNGNTKIWTPRFTITPAIAKDLMEIEAAKGVVEVTAVPPEVASELRRRARIRSTHYSTRIEGDRLTLAEAEEVIEKKRSPFMDVRGAGLGLGDLTLII